MRKLLTVVRRVLRKNKGDFASRVLVRYSTQKTVSVFCMQLFKSESEESINKRFKKTNIKSNQTN